MTEHNFKSKDAAKIVDFLKDNSFVTNVQALASHLLDDNVMTDVIFFPLPRRRTQLNSHTMHG